MRWGKYEPIRERGVGTCGGAGVPEHVGWSQLGLTGAHLSGPHQPDAHRLTTTHRISDILKSTSKHKKFHI